MENVSIDQPAVKPMESMEDSNKSMQNIINQESTEGTPSAPKVIIEGTPSNESTLLEFKESLDQPIEGEVEQSAESGAGPLDALIEIDGIARPAREWKEGFMKSQDYTKKTQELAEKRKQTEQLTHQTQSMQKQYAAGLGLLTKAARDEVVQYDGVDWQRMANEAPVEYIKHQANYNAAIDNLRRTEEQAKAFFHQVNEQVAAKRSEAAVGAIQNLQSTFKNWNNETYYKLIDYGVSTGLDRQQLLQSTDPNMFKALHKARMFDMSSGVKTTKVAGQPSQSFDRNSRGQFLSKRNSAIQRLKTSGTRADGEMAMQEFLTGR